MAGALQHATSTRFEVSFAVNKMCQFMANSLESHWVAVKKIVIPKVSKGYFHLWSAVLSSFPHLPLSVKACCNADQAADPDVRRSTSGAAVYLGPNWVSWWGRK